MVTLKSVQAKIAKLQMQADAIIAMQSSEVLERIRVLMETYRLTTADIDTYLGARKRGRLAWHDASAVNAISAVRYRDPKTGATWTGRGRPPAWIAGVKDRTHFLNISNSSSVVPGGLMGNRAGNYSHGPRPAKYCDPVTGSTWSGRGRPPAWLSGVPDRNEYLIDGLGAQKARPLSKIRAAKGAEKGSAENEMDAKKSVATAKESRTV
jgi:DNA-binding protein H-NS